MVIETKEKTILVDTIPLSYYLTGIFSSISGQNIKKVCDIPLEEKKVKQLALFFKNKNKLVTPYVLAEVSTIANRETKGSLANFLKCAGKSLSDFEECWVKKEELLNATKLLHFGLTDISLLKAGNKQRVLITGESKRGLDHAYRSMHGNDAINV